MRHLLLFVHLLGFVLWMGGGFAAMSLGIGMRNTPRSGLALMAGIQGQLHRTLILPGCLLVVFSGILLTLRLYGGPVSAQGFSVPLMVMQGVGLLAAVIVLAVSLPTVTRLVRLDPTGEQAPLFAALQRRSALAGSLTGTLALVALLSGALLR